MIESQKFAIVIVTFNPDVTRLKQCFLSIANQVDKILLYDNGSKNASEIDSLQHSFNNILFLKGQENQGLAKPYNKALRYARENNYDFLLILDQDTICAKNLITEYKRFADKGYAALSPSRLHHNKEYENHIYKTCPQDIPHGDIEVIPFTINSGTCINLNIVPRDFFYDERLFLDFLEHDFCLYLQTHNLKLARVNTANILVEIGNPRKHTVLKREWFSKNYSTHRLKINAKDFIIFLKKNWLKQPSFVNQFVIATLWMYWMIIFEKNRIKKYFAIFTGLIQGLFTKVSP